MHRTPDSSHLCCGQRILENKSEKWKNRDIFLLKLFLSGQMKYNNIELRLQTV